MTRNVRLLMAAGAIAIAPGTALAAPPSGGHPGGGAAMHSPTTTTTTTTSTRPSSPGIAPAHTTGQPMQSCETTGSPPGGSGAAPGSAFSGGTADSKYAGTQPQNSKNSASTSQYDVACANQPH